MLGDQWQDYKTQVLYDPRIPPEFLIDLQLAFMAGASACLFCMFKGSTDEATGLATVRALQDELKNFRVLMSSQIAGRHPS